MVRLGLGSVDISDHVVVQEAGGKREREVQLTDVANEVKIKRQLSTTCRWCWISAVPGL